MNFDYCEGQIHVIKAGDTLYNISRMHNVPLAMILRANPYVDVYNLQIGDEVCVPVPMPMPTPSVPSRPAPSRPTPSVPSRPGPSMPTPSVPSRPGPSMPTPSVPARPGTGPAPLPTPSVPPGAPPLYLEYMIQDGDTIQKILDFFQITLEDLLKLNDLKEMYLEPGIQLKIMQEP